MNAMLKICHSLSELSFGQLMSVYEEGNRLNAGEFYAHMDSNAALLQAEQDFYAYLEDCFFKTDGAWYAVWEVQGRYVSALRMEPYEDGLLLEALETLPEMRRRGFALLLMTAVLEQVDVNVYSHVHKGNFASVELHRRCGFQIISDRCVYIDGSESDACVTLRKAKGA